MITVQWNQIGILALHCFLHCITNNDWLCNVHKSPFTRLTAYSPKTMKCLLKYCWSSCYFWNEKSISSHSVHLPQSSVDPSCSTLPLLSGWFIPHNFLWHQAIHGNSLPPTTILFRIPYTQFSDYTGLHTMQCGVMSDPCSLPLGGWEIPSDLYTLEDSGEEN